MRTLWKWLSRLVLVLIVLAGVFFVHVWYFKPLSIDWFYGRTFAQFALKSPMMLSSMRILPRWLDFHSDDLDDMSPAHQREMAAKMASELAVLRSYDRAALDADGRLSFDSLEHFLADAVEGDRFNLLNFPVNQMFGVQSALPNFLTQQHAIGSVGDAEDYIRRMEQFPRAFGQVLEGLRERDRHGTGTSGRDRRQRTVIGGLLDEHTVAGLSVGGQDQADGVLGSAGHHDLAGLRLARHAIGRMHGGTENIAVLQHDRTEMAADADRDRLAFDLELRVNTDVVLHSAGGVERVIGGRERRHDLVADRLDDRAVILLGRGTHDLDAGQDHVARAQIPHHLVDPRAADDIGKQNG